jgi:hypothetical protein
VTNISCILSLYGRSLLFRNRMNFCRSLFLSYKILKSIDEISGSHSGEYSGMLHCLSIDRSIDLSIFLSICLSVCPSVRLFIYVFIYGVRRLCTAGTNGHIVHPTVDFSLESDGGMILTGENRRTRRKTCPSATLSTLRCIVCYKIADFQRH